MARSLLETPSKRWGSSTPLAVNNAGAKQVYAIDDMQRLRRFLILGTDGGTYYQSERAITDQNVETLARLIGSDARAVVDAVVELSVSGRAPKNDYCLFALAAVAGHATDAADRKYALSKLTQVARTGTHLFQFLEYAQKFRGWGRSLKTAVADWYLGKDTDKLSYQLVKYRQRNGWTHRDALRLSHPKTKDSARNALFNFAVTGNATEADERVQAFDYVQKHPAAARSIALEGLLPWEAFPTEALNDRHVWECLLSSDSVPYGALVRQLPRLTRIGLLGDPAAKACVVEKLTSHARIAASRMHPVNLLNALVSYRSGRSQQGSGEWLPVQGIADALDAAFYQSFKTVEPTGKRILLALDVSGSMGWATINGLAITPMQASVAMAMATLHAEQNVDVTGFSHTLVPLDLSVRRRLDDNIRVVEKVRMGATDCGLPMLYAMQTGTKYDAFIVYTDNETWYGKMPPANALREYRVKSGVHDAKLIVNAMTATNFSIADPDDPNMLDMPGLDSAAPKIMGDFIREGF